MTSQQRIFSGFEGAGIITLRGVVMPERYLNVSDAVDNLLVRADDVWVISYPKAGTTWTQEMVWCIANDLNFEAARELLDIRFPFLENCMMLSTPEQSQRSPRHVRDSVDYVVAMQSPRFIKTHLPWQLLPRQLQDPHTQAKIIYVARNAKDVCVSLYHHLTLLSGYKESLQEFGKEFLADKIYYSPYWPHILDYWTRRHQPNILYITYEDMKRDLPSVIHQTSSFLGKRLDDVQVSALATHLSFASMRNNPAVNHAQVTERLRTGEGEFLRKGVVGDWTESMSEEMGQEFTAWIEENLRDTGLTFQEG